MQFGLLLVLAALPFLEIALLIKVGELIGFWMTLTLVLTSAALGTYVIYEQGFQVMTRAVEAMGRGKPPVAPVIDGIFILLAGVLLIMPGFLSDIFGLTLLVPALRHRFAVWCLRRLLRSGSMRVFMFGARPSAANANDAGQSSAPRDRERPRAKTPQPPVGDGPIIEGEFQRLGERTVDQGRRDRPPPGPV